MNNISKAMSKSEDIFYPATMPVDNNLPRDRTIIPSTLSHHSTPFLNDTTISYAWSMAPTHKKCDRNLS